MISNRAKIFKNGDSQAIRLPKQFRFKGKEVYIRREGKNIILTPIDDVVDRLWETLNEFSSDLKIEREQPTQYDKRDSL
ncbi:AbrB/MazE/SpoVT family DNA-binding domain-containing protein [Leptospira semungkisensis]|uniref:AbrB/MazE/SpoVT family DNA-binding domain-containing protein n=1 Tax=Leptospira semungkisensis TaxID=2484985 RepID=A0A4R9G782_9LEPT|nr:type II toxin-antitoxin system VapB family antitoxin [Leptospira semungkisensis]TGK06647.1 AbrB/MazE/SpoVT family DNA-binding domain-containing protein [Leptospira semungkisensis]